MPRKAIAFIATDTPEAQKAQAALNAAYGGVEAARADVIVALGGDGHMLRMLHEHGPDGKAIYGMNRGSVGFLMNEYQEDGLQERLNQAESTIIRPLHMRAIDAHGKTHQAIAYNEVSMLRQTYQAAKLKLSVDGRVRLDELVCDGALLATPAGSTAYNLSAHGPILPIDSQLLALTPISAFRPRRWRGAILPHAAKVRIEVLESEKRPVSAVADHHEIRDVKEVSIAEHVELQATLLFDPGHSLGERVLAEQFKF
jgi:NAD+ kinase